MAKRRVTVAEKAQTEIADKIKTVKSNKMATFKKVDDSNDHALRYVKIHMLRM